MYITRYSYQTLMKIELSPQTLETFSNTKFHENPSCRRRVVPPERTDRHNKCRLHNYQSHTAKRLFLTYTLKIKNYMATCFGVFIYAIISLT
jgi:hypothetical protein